MQEAINIGATASEAARAAHALAEQQGLQLNPTQVEQLKTRAEKMKPISPTIPTTIFKTPKEIAETRMKQATEPLAWIQGKIGEATSFFGSLFNR